MIFTVQKCKCVGRFTIIIKDSDVDTRMHLVDINCKECGEFIMDAIYQNTVLYVDE